jgi:serine/threonine-protein kinase
VDELHSTDHDDDAPDARPARRAPVHAPTVPGYEILGELGRGGMGVVYRARHVRANRVVALKMILTKQHASPKQKARFQTEVEAVERLDHPHIVHLHEVGEYDGLPFFSLEFCEGGTLAQYLRERRPTAKKSAALVEKLARAIHHAHTRGIVHRDLKPENVLLTADGKPKVTDFGLAKCLDGDGDASRSGAVLGTPAYMAPEQAAGRVHDIGPAADVYALGAILYQCLTGRPPFEGPTAAVLVDVLEREPIAPTALRSDVPRDLETITLKCLHKDPGRRYDSAEALADDLRRWQVGEPVRARPAGVVERAGKWVRRSPAVAALVAALVGVVLLAGAGVYWKYIEARKHRKAADALAEELREQQESSDALLRAARYQAETFRRQALDHQDSREMAEKRAEKARQEAEELRRTGEKERAAARAALDQEQAAAAQARRAAGTAEEWRQLALETAGRIAHDVHARLKDRPELKDIRKDFLTRTLLELEKPARDSDLSTPSAREFSRQTMRMSLDLGDLFLADGANGLARWQFEEAFELAKRLDEALPHDVGARRDLALTHIRLGDVDQDSGLADRALLQYRHARRIHQELADDHPRDVQSRRDLAASHERVAGERRGLAELPAAVNDFRRALLLRQRLADESPGDRAALHSLAAVYGRLGDTLLRLGDGNAALTECDRCHALLARLVADAPEDLQARLALVGSFERRGDVRLELGNTDLALEDYRAALRMLRQRADDTGDLKTLRVLADVCNRVADAEYRRGDVRGAVQARRESVDVSQRMAKASPNDVQAMRRLVGGYGKLGNLSCGVFDFRQAVFWFENAAEVCKRLPDENERAAELKSVEVRLRGCREIVKYLDVFQAVLRGTEPKQPDGP